VSIQDHDPSEDRYRPKPKKCAICGKPFSVTGRSTAKTCPEPECKAEYERRYAREYYSRNPDKIIAQTSASRRRRHKPIFKHCKAPHPTIPGALCGKEFEVKTTRDGRRLTCSPDCSRRRRWALQRDRYHDDPQAKRDYKNAHYAANYAKPVGTTRCPNPACGREYLKRRSNQHTCGRAVCHLWQQGIKHRDKINARKRDKRRANPGADAAYQRKYREANPAKFKGYHAKRRANPEYAAYQRKYRIANRQQKPCKITTITDADLPTDGLRAAFAKARKTCLGRFYPKGKQGTCSDPCSDALEKLGQYKRQRKWDAKNKVKISAAKKRRRARRKTAGLPYQ
jgi:hypothetical protein